MRAFMLTALLLTGCATAPVADRTSAANGVWNLTYDCKGSRFGGWLRSGGKGHTVVIREGILSENTANLALSGTFGADGGGRFEGQVLTLNNKGWWKIRGELAPDGDKLVGSGFYEQQLDVYGGPCTFAMTRQDVASARFQPAAPSYRADEVASYNTIGPVGTRVYPDTGGWIEIVEISPEYVRTVNANGFYATRWGGVFYARPEIQFDRKAPMRLWPLELGKKVSFVASSPNESWDITLSVLRREAVSVGARWDETFVVERHSRGRGSNTHESYEWYWFAPSYGTVIKYDMKIMSGTWGGRPPKPWTATKVERQTG